MRQRFNRNAICSSENYRASRNAHIELLKENHATVCNMIESGKLEVNQPVEVKQSELPVSWCISGFSSTVELKEVKVFGKLQKVTIEEYNKYYKQFGF